MRDLVKSWSASARPMSASLPSKFPPIFYLQVALRADPMYLSLCGSDDLCEKAGKGWETTLRKSLHLCGVFFIVPSS